jgi:hypothetical protein
MALGFEFRMVTFLQVVLLTFHQVRLSVGRGAAARAGQGGGRGRGSSGYLEPAPPTDFTSPYVRSRGPSVVPLFSSFLDLAV